MKNNIESEEIAFTDIADLLQLQLQDADIVQSMILKYNENNSIISHPSNGEIWKNLADDDIARGCYPLFLKVCILT